MISKYIWFCLLLTTLYVLYAQNYFKIAIWNFLPETVYNSLILTIDTKSITTGSNSEHKIFTSYELSKFKDIENGLYLSILGQVFDVSKGTVHYGPGATYHAFTGRDASLAFITGEFNDKGLIDDVSSLSAQQIKSLDTWVQFYKKNYIYKGKLSGRYYNKDGSPTAEFLRIQKEITNAKKEIIQEEHSKKMFPPCNVEWKPDTGTTVWCSKRSGGIQRNWDGVPRMLFDTPDSQQYRCACVKLDSKEYIEKKGSLREYIGCTDYSKTCFIKTN